MSPIEACWQAWMGSHPGSLEPDELRWLHELNIAAFSSLEKNLMGTFVVQSVPTPAFLFRASNVEGVQAMMVSTQRLVLPDGTPEELASSAAEQLAQLVCGPASSGTMFVHAPILPLGNLDHDGSPNRRHMSVRLAVTGYDVLSVEPWRE